MTFHNVITFCIMAGCFYRFYKERKIKFIFWGLFLGLVIFSSTSYYGLIPHDSRWILGATIVFPALIFSVIEIILFIKDTIKKFRRYQ